MIALLDTPPWLGVAIGLAGLLIFAVCFALAVLLTWLLHEPAEASE